MNKVKKRVLKFNSVLITVIFTFVLLAIPNNKITLADEVKPKIDVDYLGANPEKPMVGQEVEFTYKITPHPFQHNVSKPKEIVLVLDTSGSMQDCVHSESKSHDYYYINGNEGDFCLSENFKDNKCSKHKLSKLYHSRKSCAANTAVSKMENLKKAANEFIKRLKEVEDLKIGIVTYNSNAKIDSKNSNQYFMDVKAADLTKIINSLRAGGGTNIGEGLRKANYILKEKGNIKANKSIILMTDGEASTYSRYNDGKYYMKLDDNNPRIEHDWKYGLEYANRIGEEIHKDRYNIFSIGYGLTSDGTRKLRSIHESMGGLSQGEDSTLFTTDNGAIDTIFNKIADELQKMYTIDNVNFNMNISKEFKVEGNATAILQKKGQEDQIQEITVDNSIKLPNIKYIRGDNHTYIPNYDSILLRFKVRANKEGSFNLFHGETSFKHNDIFMNIKDVNFENPRIDVLPYEVSEANKLQVIFRSNDNDYLIGDKINAEVSVAHPNIEDNKKISYRQVNFDITNGIPNGLKLDKSTNAKKEFGTIDIKENPKKSDKYSFDIEDDSEITETKSKTFDIKGEYFYNVFNNGVDTGKNEAGEKQISLNVKRGQVKVAIFDSNNKPIRDDVTIELKGKNSNPVISSKNIDGEIIFDSVPTGSYEVKLLNIPEEFKLPEVINKPVSISYKDNIGKVGFNLVGNAIDNKVTITTNDSASIIEDKYDSRSIQASGIRYDKEIKNDFNEPYKLFGDSYADIRFSGANINYLQYQAIKSSDMPKELPDKSDSSWKGKSIYENGGIINEDVDKSKFGYLTNKSYDVSHMTTLGDVESWSDRNEVFKNPFEETGIKPTTISENKNDYLVLEKYIDENGKEKERWVPNSIFTQEGSYGSDYKESRKSWGYLKVPENGNYRFRAWSDDGFSLTLTVDDIKKTLIDEFKPRGYGSVLTSKEDVSLKSTMYYPIYMEYFNWGGDAALRLEYQKVNKNGQPEGEFINVPSEWFYPSKSKVPGEQGTNVFTGQCGMKIPEEVGTYYIAYNIGHKDGITEENQESFGEFNIEQSGVYGPFVVDERFILERKVIENGASKVDDIYELEYKIIPKEILISDMYKSKADISNIKEKLEITQMKLKDVIPEGLTVKESRLEGITNEYKWVINEKNIDGKNFSELIGTISGNIEYKINSAKTAYNAKPITVKLNVIAEDTGEKLFKDKDGILLYKDVSVDDTGSMKEQHFGGGKFDVVSNSKILQHGLYNNTEKIDMDGSIIDIIPNQTYTMGLTFKISEPNTKLNINLPQNKVIDLKNVKIYEVSIDDENNIMIDNNIKATYININSNHSISTNGFTLKKGKKYLIVYTATFHGELGEKFKIESSINNNGDSGKRNILELKFTDIPELF